MQDTDRIERRRIREHALGIDGLKEVLIALDHAAEGDAVESLGEKNLRLYLRVYGLGENVVEGQAEEKRTEIVYIGDGAEAIEVAFRGEACFLAALAQRRRANAAVNHPEKIQVNIGSVAGPGAEFSALRPSAQREIFRAQGRVHAGIHSPVERIADDVAFGGGAADGRYEESRTSHFPGYGMSRVREVENWESVQNKCAVVDGGVAAHVHDDFVSLKLPLGLRKFAGSDGAVINQVMIGAGLFHDFAGEGKRGGRGQQGAATVEAKTRGGGHVVEASGLGRQIVGSIAGSQVVIVRATIERKVSRGGGLAAI